MTPIENLIVQKAIEEIELKELGLTQQFLEVHEIDEKDGHYKIAKVQFKDDCWSVFFNVKDETFYFRIFVNEQYEAVWAETVNKENVWFRASSDELDAVQMSELTTLYPTKYWNKGDVKFGKATYSFSAILIEPDTGLEELNIKLENLLTYLEQDHQGVIDLTEKAHAFIQISIDFYNGNGMFGGPYLTKEHIKRIAALGLSVDCDYFATGNPFRDD